MTKASKAYTDYVVFVECKWLRGRSKAEYLRQVRKLAEYYPGRSLKTLSERQRDASTPLRHPQQSFQGDPLPDLPLWPAHWFWGIDTCTGRGG